MGGVTFSSREDSQGFISFTPGKCKAEPWTGLVLSGRGKRSDCQGKDYYSPRSHNKPAVGNGHFIYLLWWQLVNSQMFMSMNHFYFISVGLVSSKIRRHLAQMCCLSDGINLKFLRVKLFLLLTPDKLSLPKKPNLKGLYKVFKVLLDLSLCKPESVLLRWVCRYSRALRITFSIN